MHQIPANIQPLKCKKEVVIEVNYSDLERYIKSITGKYLEIPCILESGNDTDHKISVGSGLRFINDKDKQKMEDFLFGDAPSIPTYHLGHLLDVMHSHKLLEAGTYLIRVSW